MSHTADWPVWVELGLMLACAIAWNLVHFWVLRASPEWRIGPRRESYDDGALRERSFRRRLRVFDGVTFLIGGALAVHASVLKWEATKLQRQSEEPTATRGRMPIRCLPSDGGLPDAGTPDRR